MIVKPHRLIGLHPDLIYLMLHVGGKTPIFVVEGIRSPERQAQLLAAGASQTKNSRHLTGHAVDITPILPGTVDKPSWHWPHYFELAKIVKDSASSLRISVEWGGDWTTIKDGPHWQLSWGVYPLDQKSLTVPA